MSSSASFWSKAARRSSRGVAAFDMKPSYRVSKNILAAAAVSTVAMVALILGSPRGSCTGTVMKRGCVSSIAGKASCSGTPVGPETPLDVCLQAYEASFVMCDDGEERGAELVTDVGAVDMLSVGLAVAENMFGRQVPSDRISDPGIGRICDDVLEVDGVSSALSDCRGEMIPDRLRGSLSGAATVICEMLLDNLRLFLNAKTRLGSRAECSLSSGSRDPSTPGKVDDVDGHAANCGVVKSDSRQIESGRQYSHYKPRVFLVSLCYRLLRVSLGARLAGGMDWMLRDTKNRE